jgi:hypothetical protein
MFSTKPKIDEIQELMNRRFDETRLLLDRKCDMIIEEIDRMDKEILKMLSDSNNLR